MNRKDHPSFTIRLLMFVFSIALFGADLPVVSAQNTNSSTTTPAEDASMQNDNMSNMNANRGGRRRRGRRRAGNMNANASGEATDNANATGEAQDNANMTGEATGNMNMGGRRRRRGRRRGGNMNAAQAPTEGQEMVTTRPVMTGRCDPMAQEQTDLSGTYSGTVDFAEGGLSGDTTLTVSGNDFSMTSGSSTQEGRIVAVTTCGYTAVTMRFGKDTPVAPGATPPPPLPTVSLRARRMGGGLSLMSVEGETRQFSFSSAGSGGSMRTTRGRRRGRRGGPNPVGIKPPTVMEHAH